MKTGEISIWVSVVIHDISDPNACLTPSESEIPPAPFANAGVWIRSLLSKILAERRDGQKL